MLFKFSGWDECGIDEYIECCAKYGYNSESSPHYIKFMLHHGADLRFVAYRKKKLLGAACLDGKWLVNDFKNPNKSMGSLPIPNSSIVLPFSSDVKCIAPFKTKCLSPLKKNIINSSFNLFTKRTAAFAKSVEEDFSKKTIATRRREIKKFIAAGGRFVDVSQFSGEELFSIYENLFFMRRGASIHDREMNIKFFVKFKNDFLGEVLYLNDKPVGIQLLITSTSTLGFFVDFINIGYDMEIKAHSIGTILMWNNLEKATERAHALALPLHFSFGFMSGKYKQRWCNPVGVGRTLI
ncbi:MULTISPECIES: GNAT family N-acetyltransferase [Edwardsiella]|uniref:Antimicrobial resistance protein Mig-14 n=1 Tax=Edwardsiella anguillarum TaxID=1821960 RepID=A0ABY8S939_9GAMM|nr:MULTISPECIES: GNAT family N-acetyltransferase [Edwardsiella]AKM47705.1 transcriptional regulator [Edwardsiella sp. EA181011]AKR77931.1 antimicrobial resistance protein Mig-14 [Edwardsiella sp. LADL05-105]RFT01832.1 transcriptional regulator [Edwardsiella anguillarum]UOU77628.1 antimicrobial resistance protein Mig-14 [Edwardsiella anguillarum]WHP78865.1 antimicrobial resistance protein Mig-14 [Edwardsiella anguillarum]